MAETSLPQSFTAWRNGTSVRSTRSFSLPYDSSSSRNEFSRSQSSSYTLLR